MGADNILIIQSGSETPLSLCIKHSFDATVVLSANEAVTRLAEFDYKSLVVDYSGSVDSGFLELIETVSASTDLGDMPIIILSGNNTLSFKLKAYELGCDDYIDPSADCDEVCARIHKAIYNQIANQQLKSRLQEANSAAYSAMLDNSDLGSNQRFLLGVATCDNLDQLGALFFSTLAHYNLSCSLQMRGQYEVKNMEANGMARDLESQLLTQMKDAGRYIDFGCRTLVNYGSCSLLIRNMPMDDDRKYGAIKDNTFALVQGVHARITALDEHQRLEHEKQALEKLSRDVKEVMRAIDESYQSVMRDIVSGVEDMADAIREHIPALALSLDQEKFFEDVTESCVVKTNEIFNQGLKVDECFKKLSDDMDKTLENFANEERLSKQRMVEEQIEERSDSVDLF